MFCGRQRELGYLERRYARPGAEFVVLWGRRRVGKSRLLYEWCREKPHLHFFAARLPGQVLLHEFGQQLAVALGQPERTFVNWDSALLALAELARVRTPDGGPKRFVVVIDEYPYLADSVPGFSTLLQRAWDTVLQHTSLFLCLTGSTYSVMRREILDGTAPLYRRHTWAYELLPLQPSDLRAFVPDLDAAQLIETYAVLGGMPRNLEPGAPFRAGVRSPTITHAQHRAGGPRSGGQPVQRGAPAAPLNREWPVRLMPATYKTL